MPFRTIQCYGVANWDLQLRTSFYLSYDPYFVQEGTKEGIAAEQSREALYTLGVFFYRDSEHSSGIILNPKIGAELNLVEGKGGVFNPPLACYRYVVETTYPTIRPLEWVQPTDYAAAIKYNKYKQKWGDVSKWLCWAEEKLVTQVTTHFIRTKVKG